MQVNKILIYFIIYSFLGWCLESIAKTVNQKRPVNSGFLYGPICPMYGIAALMMIGISNLSKNVVGIFILSFFIFSLWEYIVGAFLEKCFKTKYWDYSEQKFNIKGRVCLKNSIYWGILGVILIFLIQPQIEKLVGYIPNIVLLIAQIIISILIVADIIVTIIRTMRLNKRIEEIFETAGAIKEKLNELSRERRKDAREHLRNAIEELKEKQEKQKIKTYKKLVRLRKAFPKIKSDNITRFMKQQEWIEEIKTKIRKYKER